MVRQRHFIVTLGRSGSNTLVDGLNQNPEIMNYGEVLGDWMPIRKIQRTTGLYKNDEAGYLDALMSNRHIQWSANTFRSLGKLKRGKISEVKLFRNIKFVGVKEFSLNLSRLRILDYIKNRRDIKVISLERKNPIDRMVSSFRLGKTGVVSTSSSVEHAKTDEDFWMDPSSVLSNLEAIDNENKL